MSSGKHLPGLGVGGVGRIPKGSGICGMFPGLSDGPGGEASLVLQREGLTWARAPKREMWLFVLFREGQGERGSAPAHERAQGAGLGGGRGGDLDLTYPESRENQ